MSAAHSAATAPGHRLDVQGLRAVAVLIVVVNHAGARIFSGGYVGVDVFFVLSGYLITDLMLRESGRTGRISLLSFYARRARRILPAATLVLVVVVLLGSIVGLGYSRQEQLSADVRWAAAFLANVHFADLGTDYFAEGLPPSPVQHYWSLAVEEQFYLVWPLLLAGLLVASTAPRRRRVVVVVVAALAAASLAWSVVHTSDAATAAYFSSLTRAWELAAGALLALTAHRFAHLRGAARQVLATTGLLAIAVAALTFDERTPMPGYHALLPVLGTVAVLAAGIGAAPVGMARLLTLRPLTWIGDLSYSLYLWHWPVLVLGAEIIGRNGAGQTVVLLTVALALSVLSYHLVENPVRRNRWLSTQRWRGLALWPTALGVVLLGGVAAQGLADHELQKHVDDMRVYAALRDPSAPITDQLRDSLTRADAAGPVAYPLTSRSELARLRDDLWHRKYRCSAKIPDPTARICPVGDRQGGRTVAVFGDSHAGEWLPALDRIGLQHGYRVVPFIKYGCVPFDVALLTPDKSRDFAACTAFRAWASERLERLHPDVLLIGGRSLQGNMTAPEADRPEVWAAGVTATIERLRPFTEDLRVLGDVSAIEVDPLDCLTDPDATMATCTSPVLDRVQLANRVTARSARRLHVPFLDLETLACLDARCPAVAGGLMVYGNLDHLSITWVEHVTDDVDRMLHLPHLRPTASDR